MQQVYSLCTLLICTNQESCVFLHKQLYTCTEELVSAFSIMCAQAYRVGVLGCVCHIYLLQGFNWTSDELEQGGWRRFEITAGSEQFGA